MELCRILASLYHTGIKHGRHRICDQLLSISLTVSRNAGDPFEVNQTTAALMAISGITGDVVTFPDLHEPGEYDRALPEEGKGNGDS